MNAADERMNAAETAKAAADTECARLRDAEEDARLLVKRSEAEAARLQGVLKEAERREAERLEDSEKRLGDLMSEAARKEAERVKEVEKL